MTFKVIQGHWF